MGITILLTPFTYQPRKTTDSDLQGRFWTLQCNFGGKVQQAFSPRRKLSIRVKVKKDLWNLTKYTVKARVSKRASPRYTAFF
jgi:hypothetical protein